MPNIFEQQAGERLGRSLTFMEKAQNLLHDDLLYRSALADAVSAVKNMLQGYLLLRIAATPPSSGTQAWQEVASSNRMPELIAACAEAGLDLRGLAPEIKRLNAERNYRTHEDPTRLVEAAEADHALKVARDVQKRIRDAVQGRGIARGAAVARDVEGARAVSGYLRTGAQVATARAAKMPSPDAVFGDTAAFAAHAEPLPAPAADASTTIGANGHTAPTATLPAPAKTVPTSQGNGVGNDDPGDSGELAVLAPSPRRRGRLARVVVRGLAAVVLLAIGITAGLLIGAPIAAGHAPGWLSFASGIPLSPASPTPTATGASAPTATPATHSFPITLGTLAIAAPTCVSSRAALALTNSGTRPLAYSVAGASAGTILATAATATGMPAVFGALTPETSQTLYISRAGVGNSGLVVVTAPAGAVQLLVPSC